MIENKTLGNTNLDSSFLKSASEILRNCKYLFALTPIRAYTETFKFNNYRNKISEFTGAFAYSLRNANKTLTPRSAFPTSANFSFDGCWLGSGLNETNFATSGWTGADYANSATTTNEVNSRENIRNTLIKHVEDTCNVKASTYYDIAV